MSLDATDDPLHGAQGNRFFHGYYYHYCYLLLYIFAGEHLQWAELLPSNIDAAKGSVEAVAQITGQLREAWPKTIASGASSALRQPVPNLCTPDEPAPTAVGVFAEFWYQSRDSWSRRVIGRPNIWPKEPIHALW